ncbi:MAG: hypothetical protein E7447_00235 [Ruminococcaceae bacterium]|nr:hypothetical protein [Oscillospiraceae bacterium]
MHIRKIFALLLALVLLPLIGCTKTETPEETVAVYLLTDLNTTIGGKDHERKTYEYDSSGFPFAHIEYLKGEKYAIAEYTYDSQGNQTAFTLQDENGEMIGEHWTREFEYDFRGRIVRQTDTYCGIDSYTYTFSYDEKGNLISRLQYEPTGELHTGTELEYGENGKLSREVIYYNPDKSNIIERQYTYDKTDRLVSIKQCGENHSFIKSEWEYDSEGKLLLENHYESNGSPFTSTEYIYDASGKLQTEIVYLGHAEHYRLEYFYDHKEYVTRVNKILPSGAVYNQSYTYKLADIPKSQLERLEKLMEEFDLPLYRKE